MGIDYNFEDSTVNAAVSVEETLEVWLVKGHVIILRGFHLVRFHMCSSVLSLVSSV